MSFGISPGRLRRRLLFRRDDHQLDAATHFLDGAWVRVHAPLVSVTSSPCVSSLTTDPFVDALHLGPRKKDVVLMKRREQ